MKKSGFTLIELLIVVAIIAILAAIAVPNFLEAQVRAKVSRSKSDMRSMSVAIEAYQVDNGDVPPGPPYHANNPPHIWSAAALRFLSTPVAFVSSIPQDVFREKGGRRGVNAENSTTYEYGALSKGIVYKNEANTALGRGYKWSLFGVGPARLYSFPGIWQFMTGGGTPGPLQETTAYDPTNGTVSRGWIVRTNKGIWDGDTTK